MARKVLLIGIGSTGWQLCEQVLEKIELEWGSSENAPWVKLLAYETDQVEGGGMNRLGRGFRMELGDPDLQALKNNPKKFDRDMNLREWYDPQVVAKMTHNSPGAGNIRQAAKIIFLYPTNARKFHSDVSKSIEALTGLNQGTAKAAATKSGLPNQGSFTIDSPNEVLVFIAGSSAGGTGSGSLIEAGYFVRMIARNLGASVDIKGLVLLPPMSHKNVAHKANTFALLKELNHFQQNHVQWKGTFAIQGMEEVEANIGEPPFDDCFLGIPKPGSGQAIDSLSMLTENFAQFVYLSAVGSAANRLNAALINPKSLHATTEHVEGCPEAFHSIGIGVVEYPAAQVFKACAARLGVHLAEKWSSNAGPADAVLSSLGISATDLSRQGSAGSMSDSLRQSIAVATQSSNPSTQLQMIATKMQQSPADPASQDSGAAARGADLAFETKFKEFVKAALIDLDKGPKWLYGALQGVNQALATVLVDADSAEKKVKSADSRMVEALNNVRQAESDPLVRAIPGWKKCAIQFWAREFGEALSDRMKLSGGLGIRSSVETTRKALLGDPAANRAGLIAQVLDRLGGTGHDNVSVWLQQFETVCQSVHDEIDSASFQINGIALFQAAFTVNSAYMANLTENWAKYTNGAITGRNPEDSCTATLAALVGTGLAEEVLANGKSRFDPAHTARRSDDTVDRPVWSDDDAQKLRTHVRPLFQDVFKTSVLEELWANSNTATTDLTMVKDNFAKPFIDLDLTMLTSIDRTPGEDVAPLLAMVPDDHAELKAKTVTFLDAKDVTSEPWRLAVVRGECMFSLMSIKGVRGDNSFEKWYESENKGSEPPAGRHTHVTMPIVSLSGVPANFRQRRRLDEGMFLCCLSVGLIDSLEFTYTMQDNYVPGQTPVRAFTHDIAASGDLLMDQRLRADMERAFDKKMREDVQGTEISLRVREFINRAEAWELTYRGRPADPGKIFEVMAAFAKYKNFWNQIRSDERIRQFVAEPLMVLTLQDDSASAQIKRKFIRPGLYCNNPNCGVMLVEQKDRPDAQSGTPIPETEESMRDRLPETCSKCGTIIKNL